MLNLPRAAGVPRSISSTFCLVEAVTATAERLALEVAKGTAGAQLSCQCTRGEERLVGCSDKELEETAWVQRLSRSGNLNNKVRGELLTGQGKGEMPLFPV